MARGVCEIWSVCEILMQEGTSARWGECGSKSDTGKSLDDIRVRRRLGRHAWTRRMIFLPRKGWEIDLCLFLFQLLRLVFIRIVLPFKRPYLITKRHSFRMRQGVIFVHAIPFLRIRGAIQIPRLTHSLSFSSFRIEANISIPCPAHSTFFLFHCDSNSKSHSLHLFQVSGFKPTLAFRVPPIPPFSFSTGSKPGEQIKGWHTTYRNPRE